MQIGMFFTSRWGRSPRADEELDAALKGLPGDTSLYHYETPVPHLLIGPAGVWILRTYHQRGHIAFTKNRWRLTRGGFMQGYMTIFGQEGIGRPDLEIANDLDSMRKYFAKHLGETAIPYLQSALIFTNEKLEIDASDFPMPALKLKQLKEFIRKKSKDRILGSAVLEELTSFLPQE